MEMNCDYDHDYHYHYVEDDCLSYEILRSYMLHVRDSVCVCVQMSV